jgi:hypothetical protein
MPSAMQPRTAARNVVGSSSCHPRVLRRWSRTPPAVPRTAVRARTPAPDRCLQYCSIHAGSRHTHCSAAWLRMAALRSRLLDHAPTTQEVCRIWPIWCRLARAILPACQSGSLAAGEAPASWPLGRLHSFEPLCPNGSWMAPWAWQGPCLMVEGMYEPRQRGGFSGNRG